MQVILTRDVPKLGQKDDVIKVKNGYAMNFLIPGRLAVPGTVAALRAAEARRSNRVAKTAELIAGAKEIAEKLKGATLTFARKARADKLFGSVSEKDIVSAAKKELKVQLEKEMVELKDAIKTLGEHTVTLRLTPEVSASITVVVEAE